MDIPYCSLMRRSSDTEWMQHIDTRLSADQSIFHTMDDTSMSQDTVQQQKMEDSSLGHIPDFIQTSFRYILMICTVILASV